MKATGIVRRVDDLGRVAIPREVRRSMGIREGDALEVYIDPAENAICLVKYSPMDDLGIKLDAIQTNLEWIDNYAVRNEAEALIKELRKIFEKNS